MTGHNNYFDPWISIDQPQPSYCQHFNWNYPTSRTYTTLENTTITSAIKWLQSNQPQTHIHCRRSLLPFLRDALSWLTGTATTRDIHSIKTRINQLITTQASQHKTLVHIVSILNITRYATQINRLGINTLMDAVRATSHINNLYNLTTSLATSINFHQMILHIRSVFANLCDSLNNIQTVSTHTMEYIDTATSGTLSPHVLPVLDLQRMLQTELMPYHQHYIYQFHQKILYTSISTCILTS